MKGNPAGFFFVGPAVTLLALCCLATAFIIAISLKRLPPLTALMTRAAERLDRGGILLPVWGVSATVLLFAATALLFHVHPLTLVGILVLGTGLLLCGVGTGVAALVSGRALARGFGAETPPDLAALCSGFVALFLSSFFPFVGWLAVLLLTASGIGAVLESLTIRRSPPPG